MSENFADTVPAPTVPARLAAIMAELEAEWPTDSFSLRLEFWSHYHAPRPEGPRYRTAAYVMWSSHHNFSVTHADPAQLPRLFRETLAARVVKAPEPVEEPEVAVPATPAVPPVPEEKPTK